MEAVLFSLQDPMSNSEEDSIRDLLKAHIPREADLRDIVEKLLEDGLNVHTLITMSDSNLNNVILHYFPVGSSLGAKLGFETAILRKKESMHSAPSGSQYRVDEKIIKRLSEFLDEEEAKKKSKKSWAISSIKSSDWDTLGRALGCSRSAKEIEYTPKRLSDLPPFGWDDRLERVQADRYMTHLSKIRRARKWIMIDAGNNHPNLLSGELGGYKIRGTPDVAVIDRLGRIDPGVSLRCIFELKKKSVERGVHQTLVGLVMANIYSKKYRPFAVLTDLIDNWILYWMDGVSIHFFEFESRAVAVGTIEDLLGEDKDIDPSAGLPSRPTVDSGERDSAFAQILNRREYVPPGAENMEDLVGFIPDDEILHARVAAGLRHLQQMSPRPEFGNEGQGYPEGWYV